MHKRILVAGLGNVFLGDDAFGVETVRQLLQRPLPEEVRVVDFGIRSYDLAYSITGGYDAIILIDAMPRGHPPGTIYLIEPDLDQLKELGAVPTSSYGLGPMRVLQMAQSLGGSIGRLYLIGCEPALFEAEDGRVGLSEPVQAAIPQALEMIESLIRDALSQTEALLLSGEAPKEAPALAQVHGE